ncbi:MAG TPA: NAD-binding protein [Nitrospiraceae bacterium]|nr:NAD-binding protein [Nitrospiraceae bacterium]
MKLALNQLIAAEISAFALSFGLVQRAAVPIDTFTAILRENALFAPALEKKLPRLLTWDYKHRNFSARHHLKDVELFLKESSSYELTASSLEGMRQVLERSIAPRLGYSDYSAIFEMVNPIP